MIRLGVCTDVKNINELAEIGYDYLEYGLAKLASLTEEEFNEAIAYYKEHSEYDTGLTAEYGDRLLTLVTCSYHHKYGRFVVIARQSMPKEVPAETVGE